MFSWKGPAGSDAIQQRHHAVDIYLSGSGSPRMTCSSETK